MAKNQLFAANERANVTAQPATIIIIKAKIMYLSFTSVKNHSMKRKYTPKTAMMNSKTAVRTITQHKRPQAGWLYRNLH